MTFEIVHKPTFTTQLLALPPRAVPQVLEKIQLLADDPSPRAPVKKRLHATNGAVYRLRSGDYRVLYTYGDGWVALLGVDNRKDVYDQLGNLVAEAPTASVKGIPGTDELLRTAETPAYETTASAATESQDSDLLPVRLDAELLGRLRVPDEYVPALASCRTLDDLLEADVPESVRNLVFEAVTQPDLDRVLQQPTLVTGDVSDLLRFAQGELLGFLLKLNPEQEKYVTWAVRGAGPTLVKGGPGTGKSTVALYRARALLDALRAEGIARPRILFTTYTNALVAFSRQLLGRLLGPDGTLVDVRTADNLLMELVQRVDGPLTMADQQQLGALVRQAVEAAKAGLEGNALQRRAQGMALERLSPAYLLEEVETVIVARELASLDAYLATPRAGREVALSTTARTAVWRVHERLSELLRERRLTTWSQMRARAAELIRAGAGPEPYDGVIVDEAQDLEPTVLRALVGLCRTPDRLFVTADANQSIYGSGFRWTHVHDQLCFRGRTGLLRKNHRSTEEIGEAAHAYLGGGTIDADGERREYVERGPVPAIRAVASQYDQIQLLARFLRGAARELRLGLGAGAVLVPTRDIGRQIASALAHLDVPATFMPGDALDLDAPCVKVLTLKSAKGLEFPIVTIAGLLDDPAPGVPRRGSADERTEALRRERRTLFVAMTRAMRALLLITPADKESGLLDGFDPRYRNLA